MSEIRKSFAIPDVSCCPQKNGPNSMGPSVLLRVWFSASRMVCIVHRMMVMMMVVVMMVIVMVLMRLDMFVPVHVLVHLPMPMHVVLMHVVVVHRGLVHSLCRRGLVLSDRGRRKRYRSQRR